MRSELLQSERLVSCRGECTRTGNVSAIWFGAGRTGPKTNQAEKADE